MLREIKKKSCSEEEKMGGYLFSSGGKKMGRDKARRFCHKSYKYNLFIRVEDENMSTMETDVPW